MISSILHGTRVCIYLSTFVVVRHWEHACTSFICIGIYDKWLYNGLKLCCSRIAKTYFIFNVFLDWCRRQLISATVRMYTVGLFLSGSNYHWPLPCFSSELTMSVWLWDLILWSFSSLTSWRFISSLMLLLLLSALLVWLMLRSSSVRIFTLSTNRSFQFPILEKKLGLDALFGMHPMCFLITLIYSLNFWFLMFETMTIIVIWKSFCCCD